MVFGRSPFTTVHVTAVAIGDPASAKSREAMLGSVARCHLSENSPSSQQVEETPKVHAGCSERERAGHVGGWAPWL